MSDPQFHTFTTAVVAALQADSQIGVAGVNVYDGPTVSGADDAACIVVGGSFDDEQTDAGSFDADWRTDGGASATRDETLRLNCELRYWTGDADIPAARAGAFALLANVSRVLRATPGLGLSALLWCHITSGNVTQELRSGAQVTVAFTVTARSII